MLFQEIYRDSWQAVRQYKKNLTVLIVMTSLAFSLDKVFKIETSVGNLLYGLFLFATGIQIAITVHRLIALDETGYQFSWSRFFKYLLFIIAVGVVLIMITLPAITYLLSEPEVLTFLSLKSEQEIEIVVAIAVSLIYPFFSLYLPAIAIDIKSVDRSIFIESVRHYMHILLAITPISLVLDHGSALSIDTPLSPFSGVISGLSLVVATILLSMTYKKIFMVRGT